MNATILKDLIPSLIYERDGLYRQIMSMDSRKVIPLYLMLFEYLDYSSAGTLLNVGMWTLESLLGEVGVVSDSEADASDSFCKFVKDKTRCAQYFIDPMLAHARLSGACITLLKGCNPVRRSVQLSIRRDNNLIRIQRYFSERLNALQYAKKYWHKHLISTSFGDNDLWPDLEWLANSFSFLELQGDQASLVASWLKVHCSYVL